MTELAKHIVVIIRFGRIAHPVSTVGYVRGVKRFLEEAYKIAGENSFLVTSMIKKKSSVVYPIESLEKPFVTKSLDKALSHALSLIKENSWIETIELVSGTHIHGIPAYPVEPSIHAAHYEHLKKLKEGFMQTYDMKKISDKEAKEFMEAHLYEWERNLYQKFKASS